MNWSSRAKSAARATSTSGRKPWPPAFARRCARRYRLGDAPLPRTLSGAGRRSDGVVRRDIGPNRRMRQGPWRIDAPFRPQTGNSGHGADRGGDDSAGGRRGAGVEAARRASRVRGLFRRRGHRRRALPRIAQSGVGLPIAGRFRLRKQPVRQPSAPARTPCGRQPRPDDGALTTFPAFAWTATTSPPCIARRLRRCPGRARERARAFWSAAPSAGGATSGRDGTWTSACGDATSCPTGWRTARSPGCENG